MIAHIKLADNCQNWHRLICYRQIVTVKYFALLFGSPTFVWLNVAVLSWLLRARVHTCAYSHVYVSTLLK